MGLESNEFYVMVMVGNSDNKLSQLTWSEFIADVRNLAYEYVGALRIFGEFFAPPDSQYQNACWHLRITSRYPENSIKDAFCALARKYNQDSIAWIECLPVEFLRGK